jgi:hypothetical protein
MYALCFSVIVLFGIFSDSLSMLKKQAPLVVVINEKKRTSLAERRKYAVKPLDLVEVKASQLRETEYLFEWCIATKYYEPCAKNFDTFFDYHVWEQELLLDREIKQRPRPYVIGYYGSDHLHPMEIEGQERRRPECGCCDCVMVTSGITFLLACFVGACNWTYIALCSS